MHRLLFLIIVPAIFSACASSTSTPISSGNYPGNISAIMNANCLGGDCHSHPTDLNTKLDLSSWEAMTNGSVYFNEIIPFVAKKSHLFGHINTNLQLSEVITPTMPLARDPLSLDDQMAFFNWIEQGAKSAGGQIPYSGVTKKIFIVNQSEDMVSVIDADTKRLVRILPVGTSNLPSAITMMPDNKSFIVAMAGTNGTIRKYDAGAYGSLGEFVSNLVPSDIALNDDGSKGYLTDRSPTGNRFGIFDPIGMKMTKAISSPLIKEPISVTFARDRKFAYICGHASDNVLRIDISNDSVMGCLTLGADVEVPVSSTYFGKYLPEKAVLSSDSKTMYVVCENTMEVVVFDLTKDSITSRIAIPNVPLSATLTPDGAELWTATWGSNAVHIISTATNKIIAEIDSVSQYPHAISFTPDGAYAYVVCELSAGGAHHHGSGGIAPSSYVVIDCRSRKILSIEDIPAGSIGITLGYK